MKLILDKDVSETSVRKIPFEVNEIPPGSTHIDISGDFVFVYNDNQSFFYNDSSIHIPMSPQSVFGNILLPDGDGLKYVNVFGKYKSFQKVKGGESFNVSGVYIFTPGHEKYVQSSFIGRRIFDSSGQAFTIKGTTTHLGKMSYITEEESFILTTDQYSLDFDVKTSSDACDTIRLSQNPVDPLDFPSADLDTSSYWASVREFWKSMSGEDKLLVESVWQGMSHHWGNLMQRLYEVDATQSIFDIFLNRRQNWCPVDTTYKSFSSGYTDRVSPDRFFSTVKSFTQSLNLQTDQGDEGKFLTIGGVSYEIAQVISPKEVRLLGANFETAQNLLFKIGGQHVEDLDEGNRFPLYLRQTESVLLDSENNYRSKYNRVSFCRSPTLPYGGRIRYSDFGIGNCYTLATFPDRVFCEDPIFNDSYAGTRILVNESEHATLAVDDAGYWVSVEGSSFQDEEEVSITSIERDFTLLHNGILAQGSSILTKAPVGALFQRSMVGCKVFVYGSSKVFETKITAYHSPTEVSIEEDSPISGSSFDLAIPADLIVDLDSGEVRKIEEGRYEDCSTVPLDFYIKTPYRVYTSNQTVAIPSLQEWTDRAQELQFSVEKIKASTGSFLGRKNIDSIDIYKEGGLLIDPALYDVDLKSGTILSLDPSIEGIDIYSEIVFQPFWSYEGSEYFFNKEDHFIYFRDVPNALLWAQDVFSNHEDPYGQYGELIDFYQENTESYYLALISLWIAYWNGPKPELKEKSLNILLGLPFAEDGGVVSSISRRRVGASTQWVVTVLYDTKGSREISIPINLEPFVGVGERFERFDMFSGFFDEYQNTGIAKNRYFTDSENQPFKEGFKDLKIQVMSGENQGVYKISSYESPERIGVNHDFTDEEDVTYRILRPAIKIYDVVNHKNFLDEFSSNQALSKYFTENTTDAEKEIAKSLLKHSLFITQIDSRSFSLDNADFSNIKNFLQNIKGSYTDFILQIFNEQIDDFAIGDGDETLPDMTVDLTSTFNWISSMIPTSTDPLSGVENIDMHAESIKGERVSTYIFRDTSKEFSVDDIGSYISIASGFRHYSKGSVAPSKPNTLYYAGVESIFSPNDKGKAISIPSLGVSTRIVEVVSANEVVVDEFFEDIAIDLEFSVAHESNRGDYKIMGITSDGAAFTDKPLQQGFGIHYQIIDKIYKLDDETINLYLTGYVDIVDVFAGTSKRVYM